MMNYLDVICITKYLKNIFFFAVKTKNSIDSMRSFDINEPQSHNHIEMMLFYEDVCVHSAFAIVFLFTQNDVDELFIHNL